MVNDILQATDNLRLYILNKESMNKFNKMYIDIYTSYKAVGIRDRNLELELDRTRRAYLDKLSTELVTAFGIMSMTRANELLLEALESLLAALNQYIKTIPRTPHIDTNSQAHTSTSKHPRKKLHKKKSDNQWIIIDN